MSDRAARRGLPLERALQGVIAILLLGAALPLGGLPLWAVVGSAAFASASLLLSWRAAPSAWWGLLGPAWLLAGLAAYTGLQSLPLPISLLRRLAPNTADVWSRALLPVGESLSLASLSLDPGASSIEAAKYASYAIAFIFAATLARARSSHTVLRYVALAGVVVALATLGHQIVSAKSVFGLYEPRFPSGVYRVGPILNPNHLAGYLNLSALVALGLAMSPREGSWRWVFGVAAVVCIGVSVRSASRGGLVALLAGLVVLGVLAARARPGSDQPPVSRLFGVAAIFGALLGGVGLAALGIDDALRRELLDTDTGKVDLVRASTGLLPRHWGWGVGRGAFESAFEPYRPIASLHVVFTHPENLPLQWLSEWGLVGAAGMVGFGWFFLRPGKLGLLGSATHAGAGAGVAAIVLHNLLDFSLELPGPAVACTVVLGALWGASNRRRAGASDEPSPATRAWARWERRAIPSFAVMTALFGVLAFARGAPPVAASRDELQAAFNAVGSGEKAQAELDALLRARLERHPADYFAPMIGAASALRAGGNPGPWIQRALELGPSVGRVHLLLAEILVRRGALAQALFELRLAAECESTLAPRVARTALGWTRDVERLAALAQPGVAGAATLDALAHQALALGELELAQVLSLRAVERDWERIDAHRRVAELTLRRLGEKRCDDIVECEEQLQTHARALEQLVPNSSEGELLLARFAVFDGDPERARELLRPACFKQHGQRECLRQLADLEETDKLDAIVNRAVALSCRKPSSCAEVNAWAARVYAGRGALGQALSFTERAARAEPSRARWLDVASLASRLGEETRERDARAKAEALPER